MSPTMVMPDDHCDMPPNSAWLNCRHSPAATTQGVQDDLHRVFGNAMLARKTGYQVTFGR